MRWIGLMVPAVACTTDPGPNADSGETTVTTPSPTDTTPTIPEDTSASLAARVVDAGGTPIEAAQVRFCRGPTCRFADSDADGRFMFDEVVVDWHSLEVIPPAGNDTLATVLVPLVFQTDEDREVDLVMVPLDPASALTATTATHEVGEGLEIALELDDLEPPTFAEDATEVAGVRLTEKQWVPVDEQQGTVFAQWLLEPFDYKAKVDIPMTFTGDFGRKDGASVKVLVGDYTSSQWLDAGTLVSKGGELSGEAKLPVVSTVVLVEAP